MDVNEIMAGLTVEDDGQAGGEPQGHAEGCDGECGSEDIAMQATMITLLSQMGATVEAAKLAMQFPTAGLFALASMRGQDPIEAFNSAPPTVQFAIVREMMTSD